MSHVQTFQGVGVIPDDELTKLAKTEINEDPKRRQADIRALQDWLKKEPHLKNVPTDDEELIVRFLRGCKFSLEKTKKKLDNYFTMRGALPEFFLNTDPRQKVITEILKCGIYLPLPNVYDPKGRSVIVMRFGNYTPGAFSAEDITKTSYMILESAIGKDRQTETMGFCAVADMRGVTMAHMATYTPAVMKKQMTFFQEAIPSRPKGFHYVYVPAGFEIMFSMVKGFMNEKLRNRLFVHGSNLNALHENIPKECLPPDLGGTLPFSYQDLTDYWCDRILADRDMLMAQEKHVSDERLRRGKPRTQDEMFGIEGSFRKLEID